MRNPKELTRAEVIRAASRFKSTRKMGKWRVIVDDRELPARPLVLEAAGVPPNDPTNSHQAVAILERLGFETRYAPHEGAVVEADQPSPAGLTALVEAFSSLARLVPEADWKRLPSDLSKEVDHYLYGAKKGDR
ncbi:MAG: hypothetical protein M3P27_03655 [Acidobacteriota bacterium]|nr:hypothetical protein [Acidobacteriota bacterium]